MENKKIGIVTIVYAENYGAVLQCYALKQTLQDKYGNGIYVLDYHSKADKIGYGIIYNTILKNKLWKQYLKYIVKLPFLLKAKLLRKKIYKKFRDDYLKPQNKDDVDVIVYGSDQIWAYASDFDGYNKIYWGEGFFSIPKVAYAASMGVVNHLDDTFVKKHISNFHHISVREPGLKLFLEGFTSCPIKITLDPTLLLSANQWSLFADSKSLFNFNYILVYNLNGNAIIDSAAKKISLKKKLKIIEILGSPKMNETVYARSTFSPQEFVTLFKFASYILTSSFHGTVFSLIFKKNFWVSQKTNTQRVLSLLDSFDFQDRFILNDNISGEEEVDYYDFDVKINGLREKSKDYLFNSIDDEV